LPSTNKQNEFILDALPYIDDVAYDETHRRFALEMIEEEQRVYPMTKDYLRKFTKPNYDCFLTQRLQGEMERISQKAEMEKLDMSRYDIPSPANTTQASDRAAWTKAIKNCEAQIENQRLRKLNLELMLEYTGEAYLRSNKFLQSEAEAQERSVYQLRSQLFELHSRRKRRQEETGEKLVQLGTQWINDVNANIKLGNAFDRLEDEIASKRKSQKLSD